MTPFDDVFYPIMAIGFSIAVVASFAAGWIRGSLGPTILLPIAILAFWAAMFLGSDLGYRAWQSIPDPPPEAFNDSSPAGALLFGWFPAGLFCVTVFVLTRLMRHSMFPEERQ